MGRIIKPQKPMKLVKIPSFSAEELDTIRGAWKYEYSHPIKTYDSHTWKESLTKFFTHSSTYEEVVPCECDKKMVKKSHCACCNSINNLRKI